MRILGHRGASADFPENTLEAFTGAMAQGADGVELDVMRCASGELVVCHDEVLTRLAGVSWVVAQTPWWKLKHADVGTTLGFAPARMPLLDDVFDALPPHAQVNIELKCDTVEDGGLSVAVAQLIARRALASRVFVSSFNPLCLVRFERAAPGVRAGYLLDPDKSWLPQAWGWLPLVAKTSVHPHWSAVTPERAARWHRAHLDIAAWTVDDPNEAKRLRGLGVEWLITNSPGRLRAALEHP